MPIYSVQAPDGRTLRIEGPTPPTEADLDAIFAAVRPPAQGPSITERALDTLPAVGGMAGGLIGGVGGTAFGFGFGGVPGAIVGAGFGGATGEATKQLGRRAFGFEAPATPTAAASQIGKQGVTQAALEVGGQGLTRGMKLAGRALLENAVRPTMTLAEEFPNVMAVIEREGLKVGRFLPFLKSGSQQAGTKLASAAGAVRTLLTKAEQSGKTFTADQVAKPVLDLVDDIAKQPLSQSDMARLTGMLDEFMAQHPGLLTPRAVKDLKQRAQAIAKPIFKAQRKGFPVASDQPLTARFHEAVAGGAKEALETIPGVKGGEKLTQELIGAKRAITQAERRRLPLAVEGISAASGTVWTLLQPNSGLDEKVRNGAIAYLVARGLGSPRTISREGWLLTRKQTGALLNQFPRLAQAMASATLVKGEGGPKLGTAGQ